MLAPVLGLRQHQDASKHLYHHMQPRFRAPDVSETNEGEPHEQHKNYGLCCSHFRTLLHIFTSFIRSKERSDIQIERAAIYILSYRRSIMKPKYILNPDPNELGFIRSSIRNNDGYCPCSLDRSEVIN